ncbi:MAG: type IV secretory system conjugative DNA transfer family protein, partial [Kangiellaceae bacterium]|nr:type IV secretory system conjugative DNA transfer family protein [Kangiellaceae bacterium]
MKPAAHNHPPAIPLGYDHTTQKAPLGFRVKGDEDLDLAPRLISDESDGGLVTIAGTGAGKGVSHVIPTALIYPGSMVILDIKGEIAAVTANARRNMGQEVILLDPFGASSDAYNPMESVDPASPDAPDQCL